MPNHDATKAEMVLSDLDKAIRAAKASDEDSCENLARLLRRRGYYGDDDMNARWEYMELQLPVLTDWQAAEQKEEPTTERPALDALGEDGWSVVARDRLDDSRGTWCWNILLRRRKR